MIQVRIPELAESLTSGIIHAYFVTVGDHIEKDAPLLEIETDKINLEIPAPNTGTITRIDHEVGDEVQVGEVVAIIDEHTIKSTNDSDTIMDAANRYKGAFKSAKEYVVASPSARKKARQLGIDLQQLSAQEAGGIIHSKDVTAYAKATATAKQDSMKFNNTEVVSRIERIKMSPRRQTIAKHLVTAKQETAMLTTFNEIDMKAVLDIRAEKQTEFLENHGIKLGLMSFFTKAVVIALKAFPKLNAEIDGDQIILKKFYDIGIAVSTEEGLIVPVLRQADQKSFASIEQHIYRLSEKAKSKQLELPDLQGGTFTITNGGVFGSLFSTPILNSPQVGILGMHTIQKRPIVLSDDSIVVRPMMYVALTYDHRIIDGKDAVQFLARVKQLIEKPYDMLIET